MNEQFFSWLTSMPNLGIEVKAAHRGKEVIFLWLSDRKERIMVTVVGGCSTSWRPQEIGTEGLAWILKEIEHIENSEDES